VSWCWLAPLDAAPEDALAAAPAGDGVLAAWPRGRRPHPGARRMDARLLDPRGAAATVSLVWPPDGLRIAFDDPAVQEARRHLLAARPYDGLTTFLVDASHYAGSLVVARGGDVARLVDDPFARVHPARVLEVGAGLLGRAPWPAGPVIERYGSAQPWPADRF
jgi:hypothetical protein